MAAWLEGRLAALIVGLLTSAVIALNNKLHLGLTPDQISGLAVTGAGLVVGLLHHGGQEKQADATKEAAK